MINSKLSNKKYYLKNRDKLKLYSKEYRQLNKTRCKLRDKNYYENNRDKFSKYAKERYLKISTRIKRKDYLNKIIKPLHLWNTSCGNTLKKKARILLQRAVRKGRIVKPNKCICCKRKLPKKLIHGHHKNYKKWWDILWLCQTCHSELHINKILNQNERIR